MNFNMSRSNDSVVNSIKQRAKQTLFTAIGCCFTMPKKEKEETKTPKESCLFFKDPLP
jgi:hypothetical protein